MFQDNVFANKVENQLKVGLFVKKETEDVSNFWLHLKLLCWEC